MKKTHCFPVISVWPFSSLLDVPMASEKARLAASLATEWVVPGLLSSQAHLEIKKGSSQGFVLEPWAALPASIVRGVFLWGDMAPPLWE